MIVWVPITDDLKRVRLPIPSKIARLLNTLRGPLEQNTRSTSYVGGLHNYTFDLRKPGRENLIQLSTSKAFTDEVLINIKKMEDLKKTHVLHSSRTQAFL